MIRNDNIQWILNLIDGSKAAIPLRLTLWDGSSRTVSQKGLSESLNRLPLSQMPHDPFANLSTLFGIGQHITLSIQPGADITSNVLWTLGGSIVQRHSEELSPWIVAASMSGLLQTALQCAASNIECRIPAFGIWGIYVPDQQNEKIPQWLHSMQPSEPSLLPSWLLTSEELPFRRRSSLFQRWAYINKRYLPPIFTANLLSEHSFSVSIFPFQSASSSRLTVWGQLLLKHCDDDTVELSGARHVYKWKKSRTDLTRSHSLFRHADVSEWRQRTEVEKNRDESNENVETYRSQCQAYALSLLEQALGATSAEPMWGSPDDPVSCVHAALTWNGKHKSDGTVEGLLSFPLKIRSRRSMSQSDRIDMEESVERTILNPLLPTSFVVQTRYDRETSVSPLAASQRCLLAALIRTATLPSEVLVKNLTNEAIMDQWNTEAVESAAARIVNFVNISSVTRQLVEAMDWTSIADDMIESWQAQRILHQVFDGSLYLGFPSPPECIFTMDTIVDTASGMSKAAPHGRFLSLLFLRMARLRSPSSMALVWTAFVHELRNRWDSRESLPNMGHVPGLDPSPDSLSQKRGCLTIGLKADYSAFVHSSEPDPDDTHCLIGQKLQVFNLGIECTVALELRDIEIMERQANPQVDGPRFSQDEVEAECSASVASTEVTNNEGRRPKSDRIKAALLFGDDRVLANSSIVDSLPVPDRRIEIIEEERSMFSGSTNRMEFYDATEGSLSGFGNRAANEDYATNVIQRQLREGARCPLHGATLIASGDQLYAPYLQRPHPLTDDFILERRMILSTHDTDQSLNDNIRSRVEIAHRLQKPKLRSDMRAFKAANPGAVFQDFVTWYGNPGNPLDDYKEEEPAETQTMVDPNDSSAGKLEMASQALLILSSTRDFWSDTWDDAPACPAMEQESLFDVISTMEMVLDHLNTLHPASLLNQMMAVNLSTSYFALVSSAGETKCIGVVEKSLNELKAKTTLAIELLSRDISHGSLTHKNLPDDRLPRYASLESIRACESACNAISEAESLICRAMSLLHKFPHQYDLVHSMLRRANGDSLPLDTQDGRKGILAAIANQQKVDMATPSLREYILRNTDNTCPSQLCVRCIQDELEGGLMLAMTKSHGSPNGGNEG